MRIIIAEDERIIAMGLAFMLKNLGHEVVETCTSGETCVESVLLHHPDAVLMDIRMEGTMDGIEAAAAIYENYKVPVIFTTAFDDPSTRERANKVGCYQFMVKPVVQETLNSVLFSIKSK